jgi:hypothetical protein
MKITSILASGALALAVVGGSVATAGAASAQPTPVPKATGNVALAGPIQYASFSVFAGHGRYHGSIQYANFTVAAPRTHVWNIGNANTLTFAAGSSSYTHTMTVAMVTPLSTHATKFSGTGFYTTDNTVKWTINGTVNWNAVSFTIVYTGTGAPYKVSGYGWIKPDGSVSGTARDSNSVTLSFTMPKGSAFEVFRYTAPVTFASIKGHDATFKYTIPKGMPAGLAGLHIVVKVHDGGYNYKHDTWAHGVIGGALTQYTITSGNILVRR